MKKKQLDKTSEPIQDQVVCNICGFVGEDHEDIYDCVEYNEEKNGIQRGQWLIDWSRRLKEKQKNQKSFSGFGAWSKQHS